MQFQIVFNENRDTFLREIQERCLFSFLGKLLRINLGFYVVKMIVNERRYEVHGEKAVQKYEGTGIKWI